MQWFHVCSDEWGLWAIYCVLIEHVWSPAKTAPSVSPSRKVSLGLGSRLHPGIESVLMSCVTGSQLTSGCARPDRRRHRCLWPRCPCYQGFITALLSKKKSSSNGSESTLTNTVCSPTFFPWLIPCQWILFLPHFFLRSPQNTHRFMYILKKTQFIDQDSVKISSWVTCLCDWFKTFFHHHSFTNFALKTGETQAKYYQNLLDPELNPGLPPSVCVV